MKNVLILIILVGGIFLFNRSNGQTGSFGLCDPDALENVTVSGLAIVEENGNQTAYFLDENQDGSADYRLNFGPFWYEPAESEATRPGNGDLVEIAGGLNATNPGVLPVVVVYEINGEFWRNPYEPFWNHFNDNFTGHHHNQGGSHAPGWLQANLQTVELSGITLVDTTFIYFHYFLDTDSDGLPDFQLNFGPPWYEPSSGSERPQPGDIITVKGGLIDLAAWDAIIIFELNGEEWRDASNFGSDSFGRWMMQGQGTTVHEPFNYQNHFTIYQGWHQGGMPPSMFCQILQTHYQNFPAYQNHHGFAGFETGVFRGGMMNMENWMEQHGYQFTLGEPAMVQFQFSNQQWRRAGIQQKDRIRLRFWNDLSQSWDLAQDASVDSVNNLVTFSSPTLYAFYMLTAEAVTATGEIVAGRTSLDILVNPALGNLVVQFFLAERAKVRLEVFGPEGRLYATLVDATLPAGFQSGNFVVNDIPNGIYFLRLTTPGQTVTKSIILTR